MCNTNSVAFLSCFVLSRLVVYSYIVTTVLYCFIFTHWKPIVWKLSRTNCSPWWLYLRMYWHWQLIRQLFSNWTKGVSDFQRFPKIFHRNIHRNTNTKSPNSVMEYDAIFLINLKNNFFVSLFTWRCKNSRFSRVLISYLEDKWSKRSGKQKYLFHIKYVKTIKKKKVLSSITMFDIFKRKRSSIRLGFNYLFTEWLVKRGEMQNNEDIYTDM